MTQQTPEAITAFVCKLMGFKTSEIKRLRAFKARQVAIYCIRQHTGMKIYKVGQLFDLKKTAATVAIRTVKGRLQEDEQLQAIITEVARFAPPMVAQRILKTPAERAEYERRKRHETRHIREAETQDKIMAMYKAGSGYVTIARELRKTVKYVEAVVQGKPLAATAKRKATPGDICTIIRMYEQGTEIMDISRFLDLSHSTVTEAIKRHKENQRSEQFLSYEKHGMPYTYAY